MLKLPSTQSCCTACQKGNKRVVQTVPHGVLYATLNPELAREDWHESTAAQTEAGIRDVEQHSQHRIVVIKTVMCASALYTYGVCIFGDLQLKQAGMS